MKFFRSAASGAVHAYDDDVTAVRGDDGVLRFVTADGIAVDAPADLSPCDAPAAAAPSIDGKKRALSSAVQRHLDSVAKGMGYDDMRSAVTYADEPAVARFQAEGRALRAWRSLVWAECYDLLDRWAQGKIAEPDAAAVIAALPIFTSTIE